MMANVDDFPKTILVIQISPQIRLEALVWFLQKLDQAGLLVRCEPYEEVKGLTLHVTGDERGLLRGAEAIGIRKPTRNGRLRSITTGTIEDFLLESLMGVENLLSAADKQFVVTAQLDQLGGDAPGESVPGYPLLPLPNGKSLFGTYLEFNLISDYFPLHDPIELSQFENDWIFSVVQRQPLEQIREYFGDGMSIYFSFLEFYTFLLIGPSLAGFLQFFFNTDRKCVILSSIFNVFWAAIAGQDLWRRKWTESSISWGTFSEGREGPRAKYRPQGPTSFWPNTIRWLKTYVASAGVILGVIAVTGALLFFSLWFQTYLEGSFISSNLWAVVDTLIILIIGHYYAKLANFLTEWENHRTDSDFEYYRIRKLVQFESLHNFLPLFYITFWLQDLNLLRSKVNRRLLIVPLTSTVQETLYPLLFRRHFMTLRAFLTRKWPGLFCWLFCDPLPPDTSRSETLHHRSLVDAWPAEAPRLEFLDFDDPRLEASRQQRSLDPYETTFDDYLETYVQFGYIFLFAGISPYAPLLGFLGSFLEIRTDAFKLCKLSRRPLAKRIHDIGPWIIAFEIIGIVSIVSNCWMLGAHSFGFDLPLLTATTSVTGAVLLFAAKIAFRFLPADHHIRRPSDL